jgi:plasmid stabilization system protein ParE
VSGYLLTPAADADLDETWVYVAQQSGAERADHLDDAMHRLARAPGIGHLRRDFADESLRFVPVHKLPIIFRPEAKPLQIIRVLHGARDVRAILGSDSSSSSVP